MGADLHLILFRDGQRGAVIGSFGSAKTFPHKLYNGRMAPEDAIRALRALDDDGRVNVDLAVRQIELWREKFPGCTIGFDDDCECWSMFIADPIDERHCPERCAEIHALVCEY